MRSAFQTSAPEFWTDIGYAMAFQARPLDVRQRGTRWQSSATPARSALRPLRKLSPALASQRHLRVYGWTTLQAQHSRGCGQHAVVKASSTADSLQATEGEQPEKSSRGSEAVKLCLLALAVGSAVLYGSGSVQGIKASASRSILGRSGFLAAFSLIFLSEIGDKTFFIAGLLATRVGKWRSLIGSTAALAIMTVISVGIGAAFNSLPDVLKSSLPVGQYLGAALMLLFGIRTIMEAWRAPSGDSNEVADGEYQEAELSISSAEQSGRMSQQSGLWQTLLQVGSLIFLAEWGDRSMLATIALGASHPPFGVAIGATLAHAAATAIAVVSGVYVSNRISERTIGLVGGALFLLFAVLTLLGYF